MLHDDPWYDKRGELLNLFNFLSEVGLEPEMPLYLEKPHKWEDEYQLMMEHPDWNNYDPSQLDALATKMLNADD